jgi:DNA-binding NtrC family response regulator
MSWGKTLIVDDDLSIRETLVEVCREILEITPLEATSAREAIAALEKNRPAVVLLDLTLPDESGEWVAEEIQRRGWADEVRTIVLSARSSAGESAEQLGAYGFLSKPFSLADVVSVLKEAGAA